MKKFLKLVAKMAGPKIITIAANAIRIGQRTVLRFSVQLLKANLFTRIVSCFTLLIFDIVNLIRKKITVIRFIKNVIVSLILIVTSTIGWNVGVYLTELIIVDSAAWIGIAAGMVGAGLFGVVSTVFVNHLLNLMWKDIKETQQF